MSKYNEIRTTIDGITFASKAEAARYQQLKLLVRAGDIEDLVLQPKFSIVINDQKICTYIADFQYYQDGKIIIEDVKGVRTPVYNLKKKLVKALHGIEILETK